MKEQEKYAGELKNAMSECEVLLIGIGSEWKTKKEPEVSAAYESLHKLTDGMNYFIVTTVTDGEIWKSSLDASRIVAPCGNESWLQCSRACTKDIWEKGELPEEICPHCSAPLIPNTITAETYIEEGYKPQWEKYKKWLSGTLKRKLLVLELGVGFRTPTVIRWPFEKTVLINQSSHMYRVNASFYQISEEIKDRAVPVQENSVRFIKKLARF